MDLVWRLFALAVLCHSALAHLCLLRPSQRGDLDISEAGSHTCFRHGAPCGGQPPKKPTTSFRAGETFFFKWQQNYNHYEVGFPGYMDLAVAKINSSVFSFLAGFGDVNWHQQSHQQNYTVPAVFPYVDCDWCVLRARYVPHKPGEDTFYQCADIAIAIASSSSAAQREEELRSQHKELSGTLKAAAEFVHVSRQGRHAKQSPAIGSVREDPIPFPEGYYGLACNPIESPNGCVFARILENGVVEHLGKVAFGVDAMGPLPVTEAPNDFILDQIAAYDDSNHRVFYIVHSGKLDSPQTSLISVDVQTGETSMHGPIVGSESAAINAIQYVSSSQQLYALQIVEEASKPGNYNFRVSSFDVAKLTLKTVYQTETTEDLYVNYQWSTVDTKAGIFYYLMGNENDAIGLTARLYAVDLAKGIAPKPIAVDASQYTLGSIQYDAAHDRLVAVSPGLNKAPAGNWSIVTINPETGAVQKICHIAPAGIFELDYSGAVFDVNPTLGMMGVRLRVANEPADVLVTVTMSEDSCSTFYSQIGNFYHIHNLMLAQT